MLFQDSELDIKIFDVNILLSNRDLKDIIVVSHTCGKVLFHTSNGIPVKEY
jgi:hypothetical protein